MLSLFKNYPCENYFNDNIEKVLPVAAEGGDDAVRDWINSQWLVFRMLYKDWIDKMFAKNSAHTEKYLKEVRISPLFFLPDLIDMFQRFAGRIKLYVTNNAAAINNLRLQMHGHGNRSPSTASYAPSQRSPLSSERGRVNLGLLEQDKWLSNVIRNVVDAAKRDPSVDFASMIKIQWMIFKDNFGGSMVGVDYKILEEVSILIH